MVNKIVYRPIYKVKKLFSLKFFLKKSGNGLSPTVLNKFF